MQHKKKKINEYTVDYYDGNEVIYITHLPTGKKSIIDNDEKVKKRVLQESKARNHSLVPRNDYSTLVFPESQNGILRSSLATVAYSEYHNIPLDTLRKYKVNHIKSGEIEDCRKCNLYCTGFPSMETQSIKINISQNRKDFSLLLKTANKEIFFSYNNFLLNLLSTPNISSPFLNKAKPPRPQIRMNELDNCFPYLSVIAYYCYREQITRNNYLKKIPEIMNYNRTNNLTVEHLNGNIYDNRKYNLALVEGKLNLSKHNLADFITAPYFFNAVMGIDNKYRIVLGKAEKVEDLLFSKLIITDTFEEIVAIIKSYKLNYPELFHKNKVQKDLYIFREPIVSEILSSMPADLFVPFSQWISAQKVNNK